MTTSPEVLKQIYVPLEGVTDPVVWQKVISPAAGMMLKMFTGQERIPRLSDLVKVRELVEWRLAEIQELLDEGDTTLSQIDEAELMNLQESSIEFGKYIARPDVAGYINNPEQTGETKPVEPPDRQLGLVA